MKYRNTTQPSFLDIAFQDIGRLQEFAYKTRQLHKSVEECKKKVCPNDETHEISSFNLHGNDNETSATPTKSINEIISHLSKLSSIDLTASKIQKLADEYGISEFHLRSLISSIIKSKYGV